MTFVELEKTFKDEEYLQILASVLKIASTIKSKSLAKKILKMILIPQDWEDRKACPLKETI